jgi:hypothetical protein
MSNPNKNWKRTQLRAAKRAEQPAGDAIKMRARELAERQQRIAAARAANAARIRQLTGGTHAAT